MKKLLISLAIVVLAGNALELKALKKLQQKSQAMAVTPVPAVQERKALVPVETQSSAVQPAFDKDEALYALWREADQARDVPSILAFKVQATKLPGITAGELNYFDHLVKTLPNVLKERARQEERFNTEISIKNLLILNNAKAALQEMDEAKKQKLVAAILPQLDTALIRLQHYYFEIGDRGLKEKVMNLYNKLMVVRLSLGGLPETKQSGSVPASKQKAKTYYDVLGVAKTASPDQIKAAFRKLAMKYHPDKIRESGLTKEEAEQLFFKINEANAILSDSVSRKNYDVSM